MATLSVPFYKMANKKLELNIEVPFSGVKEAKIAYEVLRVDREPPRSQVSKSLEIDQNVLLVSIEAPTYHQLRTGVNGFLESILLISETLLNFGPPLSTEYTHHT